MRNLKIFVTRSSLLLTLLVVTCFQPYGQTEDAEIHKRIDELFSRYNATTPGVAVAVVKNGEVVFKKGYGSANLELDRPINTRTAFQIASVSKQLTAFAIYLLEQQGKLSLDDDVRKFVPEMPSWGGTVRIKHLLAHTSGFKDQASLFSLAGRLSGDVATTEHVLRVLARQRDLNFEPGSQYLYSNFGYTLLAEIVKRASGESFGSFAKKNIFVPLGMHDTHIYDDHQRIIKNRADSYALQDGSYKRISSNDSAAGAPRTSSPPSRIWRSGSQTSTSPSSVIPRLSGASTNLHC